VSRGGVWSNAELEAAMASCHGNYSDNAGCQVRRTPLKLAQKLGRLQPFVAVFQQECMGQALANLHFLG
jgi:hypothetical protein